MEYRIGALHVDVTLGALRAIDQMRPVTPLMPARDDQLEQIDGVIGMQVSKKNGINFGTAAAGGIEALGDARAAIDQIGAALMARDL